MNKSFPLSGFSSVAIHAGHETESNYSHLVPIYASSTYVFDDSEHGMNLFNGREEGYIYSRWGNPTVTEAAEKIAALETFGITGKEGNPLKVKAILHSSGMAAISTVLLGTLKAGDKILSQYSLYGGTHELMHHELPKYGIETIITDMRNLDKAEDILKTSTAVRLIYIETPANPTIQCVDIEKICALARQYNKLVVCDNTFATPYLQQPFRYDADFVVHSTTKFLNGHGTAIGGVLLGRDMELMKTKLTKTHRLLGGNSNAFDAFLLLTGMKTLEIRMDRHCRNAMELASYLETHPSVAKVNYNGLSSHPDFSVSAGQMRYPGAMLSFELKEGMKAGMKFIDKLQMCVKTVSLGTVDTLISHPASTTHYGVPEEQRRQYGITDGLIRVNTGIENIEDILNDVEQALQ